VAALAEMVQKGKVAASASASPLAETIRSAYLEENLAALDVEPTVQDRRRVDPGLPPAAGDRYDRVLMTEINRSQERATMSTNKTAEPNSAAYLLAGRASELERLQLQSRVWEPSGRRLLAEIGDGRGARALDVGCGVLGWLRVLSHWVGREGEVTGTDIDESMLSAANRFVTEEGLRNVGLVNDDLFASALEPDSFDLVHARYEICPLGRGHEQMETYLRLARPGAAIVLEDPDTGSWHFNPPAPALQRLIALIEETFRLSGGDWQAGRKNLHLLHEFGIDGNVRAEVVALASGHPYLRLPLQFATSLEERLLSLVSADELQALRDQGETELHEPGRWGTTFTLLQCWGRRPRRTS
jgi:SAM-dependent methyltransferase